MLFEDKFRNIYWDKPKLDGLNFKTLRFGKRSSLTQYSKKEEIEAAVWECDGNNCPGLDEFNFMFIKENWHTLKPDIWRLLYEFFEKC